MPIISKMTETEQQKHWDLAGIEPVKVKGVREK